MPSMDLGLIHVDYDFVPETSHFLQFEGAGEVRRHDA